MQDQREGDLSDQIPEEKIVEIIQEFLDCLNYRNTRDTFRREKCRIMGEARGEQEGEVAEEGGGNMEEEEESIERDKNRDRGESKEIGNEKQEQGEMNENVAESKQEQQPTTVTKSAQVWSLQKAKFVAKFANFSQILVALHQTIRNKTDLLLPQPPTPPQLPPQLNPDKLSSKPILLHIFSTFDSINKVRQFRIPIYHTTTIQSKFGKKIQYFSACPHKNNLLVLVDQLANIMLYDVEARVLCHSLKMEEGELFTGVAWLKLGMALALSTKSGKLLLYTIRISSSSSPSPSPTIQKLTTLTPHTKQICSIYSNREYIYTSCIDYTVSKVQIRFWKIQQTWNIKCSKLNKICKIQGRQFGGVFFGVVGAGGQVVVVEEGTGNFGVVFDVGNQHLVETRKIIDRKEDKITNAQIVKFSTIFDIVDGRWGDGKQEAKEREAKEAKDREGEDSRNSIVCVQNCQTGNIEIYGNKKEQLRIIRSQASRPRPFLAPGIGFPTTAQGFLQLLQTIRQNYNAFA